MADYNLIKTGFTNYIGALLLESPLENKDEARHDVVANLCEQILKISKNEDSHYDLKVLKPMLKTIVIIFKSLINDMQEDVENVDKNAYIMLSNQMQLYKKIVSDFENIIQKL